MRRATPWLVAGSGGLLVVAGVVVFVAANPGPREFGWAAYAPLESAHAYQSSLTVSDSDGVTVLWTGHHLFGAGLLVLALLLLVGLGGWLLGLRAGRGRNARS